MVVDEFVDWLRNREYYTDQIQFQRSIPARRPDSGCCDSFGALPGIIDVFGP